MYENRRVAALFSDFDGTAVEKLLIAHPWRWPQNLAKYPLAPMPGWAGFIKGAEGVEGVHFRGIVSRRRRFRKGVTELSLARTGLDADFHLMSLAGSEEKKAKVLADAAFPFNGTIGHIDDMPQKLIEELIAKMAANGSSSKTALYSRIHLGVVEGPSQLERIRKTLQLAGETGCVTITGGEDVRQTVSLTGHNIRIDVTPLPAYSHAAGVEFGEKLLAR